MEPVYYVLFAGITVWLAIGLYVFVLGLKQNALAARIAHLEALQEDNDGQ